VEGTVAQMIVAEVTLASVNFKAKYTFNIYTYLLQVSVKWF